MVSSRKVIDTAVLGSWFEVPSNFKLVHLNGLRRIVGTHPSCFSSQLNIETPMGSNR